MLKVLSLLMLLNLVTAPAVFAGGDFQGNGGDPIHDLMIRAKGMAVAIVQSVSPSELSTLTHVETEPGVFRNLHQWYESTALAAELSSLKLELNGTNGNGTNANGLHGQTGSVYGSVVYLARQKFYLGFPLEAAAELLIREAVHHFDERDEFAGHMAVAIMDAFHRKAVWLEGERQMVSREFSFSIQLSPLVEIAHLNDRDVAQVETALKETVSRLDGYSAQVVNLRRSRGDLRRHEFTFAGTLNYWVPAPGLEAGSHLESKFIEFPVKPSSNSRVVQKAGAAFLEILRGIGLVKMSEVDGSGAVSIVYRASVRGPKS